MPRSGKLIKVDPGFKSPREEELRNTGEEELKPTLLLVKFIDQVWPPLKVGIIPSKGVWQIG